LKLKLSGLIDDYLDYNSENERGIARLRSILAKAVKAIDDGWPPLEPSSETP
jgi:hypothetical protein